jgi:hypothetical protein
MRAHEEVYMEYVPNKNEDQNEIMTMFEAKRHPENLRKFISGIYRVALPKKGMFELDEKGTIDDEYSVKQAIVYRLNQYVENPDRPMQTVASCTTKIGTYQKPVARLDYDKMGNVTNSTRVGSKNMFYIPYSAKFLRDLIAEVGNAPNITCCTIGLETGSEFHTPKPEAIANLEEFIDVEDIYSLIDASKWGYISKDPGGYQRYLDDKKAAYEKPQEFMSWRKQQAEDKATLQASRLRRPQSISTTK